MPNFLLFVAGETVGIITAETEAEADRDALAVLEAEVQPISSHYARRLRERIGLRDVPVAPHFDTDETHADDTTTEGSADDER